MSFSRIIRFFNHKTTLHYIYNLKLAFEFSTCSSLSNRSISTLERPTTIERSFKITNVTYSYNYAIIVYNKKLANELQNVKQAIRLELE